MTSLRLVFPTGEYKGDWHNIIDKIRSSNHKIIKIENKNNNFRKEMLKKVEKEE